MFKWPIDPLLQQHLNLSNSLGPELTTNGTFTGSAAGWTLGSGWTYAANTADKDGAGTATLSQAVGAVANKVYLVSYVLTVSVSTGGLTVAVGGVSGTNRTAAGTYREYIKATGTGSLTFTPGNTAFRGVVDTVSVKEVGTAPADQVTVWVEDQGGTAGKATLYIRGENGTVVGIGGDGLTFGANDEDVTLAYTADTLTLAGGVLLVPVSSVTAPALSITGDSNTGIFSPEGGVIGFTADGSAHWVMFGATDSRLRSTVNFGWSSGDPQSAANDLTLLRDGAAILQMGVDAASPIAQTFKGPDARAGTDTDTVGGRINWRTGLSTGNAVPAIQSLQGGAATVTSGTGAQTVVDRFIPNAFKVLTNNVATALVNATIANGTSVGGLIVYTIEVWDGTDNQVETGFAVYSSKNKAGVVTGTITEVNSQQNLDSGTLATTWAISAANPAVISINANSSLTPSTGYPRITAAVFNHGQQAVAIQ